MEEVGRSKWCELCNTAAKVFCAADEASLCWQCDTQVHTANFLVARHLRSLLCHACGSPTGWMETGSQIDPDVRFCRDCGHNENFNCNTNRDGEESQIASSESSVVSSFYDGDSVGLEKMRIGRVAMRAKVVSKAGMGYVGDSSRRVLNAGKPGVSCGSISRTKRHRFDSRQADFSTKATNQPADTEAKMPTELSCKDWSAAISSGVESEDEESCESNEVQLPADRVDPVQTSSPKRSRKPVLKQIEEGINVDDVSSSSHTAKTLDSGKAALRNTNL